jgi:hypothetical protein
MIGTRFGVAVSASAGLAIAAGASGQSFVNGNFETGDLSGWTVTPTANGHTNIQVVEPFDIDGPGPLSTSMTAHFQVGQVVFASGDQEGIELTQMLTLTAGVQYQLSINWAATNLNPTNNVEGGVFTLFAGTSDLMTQAAGALSSSTPMYGVLASPFTPASTGSYSVGVRITRPFTAPTNVQQWIDNASIAGGTTSCYANCDGSTASPVLNVADFTCFLQKFAIGDPYANCDGSTASPVLNVADFTCFLQKFAQGCP